MRTRGAVVVAYSKHAHRLPVSDVSSRYDLDSVRPWSKFLLEAT